MIKKLLLMAGLAVVLAFALVAGKGTPTGAFVPPGIQDFNVDMVNCLVPGAITSENIDAVTLAPVIDVDDCTALTAAVGLTVRVDSELMTLTGVAGCGAGAPQDEITLARTAANMVAHPQPKAVFRDTITPDPQAPGTPPISCIQPEAKGLSGTSTKSVSLTTAIALPAGDRLGYPYVYNGPGPVLLSDLQITDGTQVGDVVSVVDLNQDGTVDVMADSTNCGGVPNNCTAPNALNFTNAIPEQYVKQGLTFGPGTGCTKPGGGNDDETYLNSLVPGVSAMTRYVRYRACIDTVYILGQYRVDVVAANGSSTPLNLVTLSPVWSPLGTHVNLVALSQIADKASPSTGILGIDSPQSSKSHTNAPYAASEGVAGLYAHWMTEISTADQADGTLNFVLSTSCKAIGGNFPDADHDCLSTTTNPGASVTDPNDNVPDIDGDGLLDGVEVAWGSCPGGASFPGLAQCALLTDVTSRDTDSDGRTDAEEMVGPTQLLTNPKLADTDVDGVADGGLTLDLDGNGIPDVPDEDGDANPDVGPPPTPPLPLGMRLIDSQADGSSHVRVGYKIVGTDIEPVGGTDNCPSVPNGAAQAPDNQVNTDLAPASSWGHGDLYGNACDTDDDNDGIVDTAELGFQYDQGAHQCSNDPDLPGPATTPGLSTTNPDSDGDGVIDGVECEVGSNPADINDSPGAPAADTDKDGVANLYEIFKRTQNFSDQPAGPPFVGNEDVEQPVGDGFIGQADVDSDGDGLSDGCEVYVTGTNPLRPNSDGIAPNDPAEPNLTTRIAAYCNSLTDLDGDLVLNDVDNCLFVSNAGTPQQNTNPEIGNGRGVPGNDSTVPWSVKNDRRGDACDGDWDNDGLKNGPGTGLDSENGGPGADISYDDPNNAGDGAWRIAPDDGPSWDITPLLGNSRLDGRETECAGTFSDMPAGWATADSDGDGLLNKWEFCKWGSSPNRWDSDGDGPYTAPPPVEKKSKGDCVEAADVDGNGNVDFTGDVMLYAQAVLLTPCPGATCFGQDGDFDIDANNNLDFTGDVMMEAQFGLIGTPGTPTGICD